MRKFFYKDVSVKTGKTRKTVETAAQELTDLPALEWVVYDGSSASSVALVNRLRRALTRRGFRLIPLQTPRARSCLGLEESARLKETKEMYVLTSRRRKLGGIDALLYIAGRIGWTRPLALLGRLPGVYRLLQAGYGSLASSRNWAAGACRNDSNRTGRGRKRQAHEVEP